VNAIALLLSRAKYPQLYTSARAALFRCDQVDECVKWSSKAAAIASYAAQANDTTLRDMANRIHARAVRRMGELLDRIPAVPPTQTRKAAGLVTRSTAAAAAGITEHQKNQAIQVSKVSERQFEELIESKSPPGISSLAKLGAAPRGKRFDGTTSKRVARMAAWCRKHPIERMRATVDTEHVREIRAWCEAFLEAM
jgi:hypothetical protein